MGNPQRTSAQADSFFYCVATRRSVRYARWGLPAPLYRPQTPASPQTSFGAFNGGSKPPPYRGSVACPIRDGRGTGGLGGDEHCAAKGVPRCELESGGGSRQGRMKQCEKGAAVEKIEHGHGSDAMIFSGHRKRV